MSEFKFTYFGNKGHVTTTITLYYCTRTSDMNKYLLTVLITNDK